MGYYIDLRGWLEVQSGDRESVADKLNHLEAQYAQMGGWPKTYMTGWCWSNAQFNFRNYLFYGGQVRFDGIDVFEQVLKELLSLGLHLNGYFHAASEDQSMSVAYRINYDQLTIEENAKPPVEYLNPPDD